MVVLYPFVILNNYVETFLAKLDYIGNVKVNFILSVSVFSVFSIRATIYWELIINPFFQLSGPNAYFPPKSKQNLECTGIK